MTVRLLDHQDQPPAVANRVSHLDDMAYCIRDMALASARAALGVDRRAAALADLVDGPGFVSHFLGKLALGVARALAANDRRVLAVYAYEPPPDGGPVADVLDEQRAQIHLLVLVTVPSAALEAFVASLNRALSASLKALPVARFSQAEPVLDISIVSEWEARQGIGIAGLLAGLRPPPVRLWQRQA